MAAVFRHLKTTQFKINILRRCVANRSYCTGISQSSPLSQTHQTSSEQLTMTDACVKQLKKVMQEGEHLRVIVEGGGCSGFQYKFDVETNTGDDDRIFAKDGAVVVVDSDSLEFIKGSKIDYHEELIKSAFVIVENPLAEEGCSCGASFNVKL